MTDEHEFLSTRGEQLARRLRAEHGALAPRAAQARRRGRHAPGRPARSATRAGAWAQAPAAPIVKPLPPEWFVPLGTNAEMRWEAMRGQGYVTPVERFFVRNHTATPSIDAATWRLRMSRARAARRAGDRAALRRPARGCPPRVVTAFIECAGNGRSLFAGQQGTPASGSQWKLGAIGVAHWRGVPLSEVLERAGITPRRRRRACPSGLDAPVVAGGVDQGHVRRPLPVAKALDDALLAYEMNGRGAAARPRLPGAAVVPGLDRHRQHQVAGEHRGLRRAAVLATGTPTQYRMTGADYPPDSPPLTAQPVKSAFELPWPAALPAGQRARAARPLVVGRPADPPGRGTRGRPGRRRVLGARALARPQPAAGVGPLDRALAAARRRAGTHCWPARRTAAARRSRTPSRSTPAAISSGPSPGIPSRCPEEQR